MLQKILVPIDGSQMSKAVVPYVQEISQRCAQVHVRFLQVERPPSGHTAAAYLPRDPDFPEKRMPESDTDVETAHYPIYRDQTLASARAAIESELAPLAQELQAGGIESDFDVAFGRPAEKIVEYAEQNKFDMIAMCTHGRSGVSRWILGSVADKVLRGTYLPVLLVRPPEITGAAQQPET